MVAAAEFDGADREIVGGDETNGLELVYRRMVRVDVIRAPQRVRGATEAEEDHVEPIDAFPPSSPQTRIRARFVSGLRVARCQIHHRRR